jgi:hypothetical protein
MDERMFATMVTQHALAGLSDRPGQFRQDPFNALLNQCYRARSGQEDGMNYLSMPF